jgi:pimeloyl-ACP methyl ester carboxylesterase
MNASITRWGTAATLAALLFGVAAPAQAQYGSKWLKGFRIPGKDDVRIGSQGVFFVNGQYYTSATNQSPPGFGLYTTVGLQYMAHQMYVEYQIPKRVTHRYPIVIIHGGAQTGAGLWSTPDGRPGWAQFWVANGYPVYVVDQVGRGRDVYTTELYGPIRPPLDVLSRMIVWSVQEQFNLFPHAAQHTQWPGTGRPGDAFFDQFYASQVQFAANVAWTQTEAQAAGAALLDKIGPAIIITHSQSGTFGFLIADKRPNLTKAVVTIEGGGTPHGYIVGAVYPPGYNPCEVSGSNPYYCEVPFGVAKGPIYPNGNDSPYFIDNPATTAYGITNVPLTYSPAVTSPAQLTYYQEATPDGPDVRCWLQTPGNVHTLPNLQGVPQLLFTAEASSAASTNRCVSKYLTQAGVQNTWLSLGMVGIHGNGHMMMLEKNHLEIAAFITRWLEDNVEHKGRK